MNKWTLWINFTSGAFLTLDKARLLASGSYMTRLT